MVSGSKDNDPMLCQYVTKHELETKTPEEWQGDNTATIAIRASTQLFASGSKGRTGGFSPSL